MVLEARNAFKIACICKQQQAFYSMEGANSCISRLTTEKVHQQRSEEVGMAALAPCRCKTWFSLCPAVQKNRIAPVETIQYSPFVTTKWCPIFQGTWVSRPGSYSHSKCTRASQDTHSLHSGRVWPRKTLFCTFTALILWMEGHGIGTCTSRIRGPFSLFLLFQCRKVWTLPRLHYKTMFNLAPS